MIIKNCKLVKIDIEMRVSLKKPKTKTTTVLQEESTKLVLHTLITIEIKTATPAITSHLKKTKQRNE